MYFESNLPPKMANGSKRGIVIEILPKLWN